MKIFKDLFTDSEILTDVYPIDILHDVLYVVKGSFQTETVKANYDIGGNPGEEEPEEQLEDAKLSGCNVVLANNLAETNFGDKKQLQVLVKAYFKKLLDRLKLDNPERADIVKANAPKAFSEIILKNFKEFQFFFDSQLDEDGMVIFMRSDPADSSGMKQLLYYWKDGLVEEKV